MCPVFKIFLRFVILILFFAFQSAFAQEYKSIPLDVSRQKISGVDETTLRKEMQADGLSDPVIDKLIAQRKLLLQTGHSTIYWMNARKKNVLPKVNAACSDMGVEGGWGGWQYQIGSNSGGNPAIFPGPPAPGPPTPNFILTTGSGTDFRTPGPGVAPAIPLVSPGFGSQSIHMGEYCANGSVVEQLTYSLTVTTQDTNFIYSYACILENPNGNHTPAQAPYCEFGIYDAVTGDTIPCTYNKYIAGPTIPGFFSINSASCQSGAPAVQYKPWTIVGVNLSKYVGKTLNVVITNADCTLGGHFADSYFDFLCGTLVLAAGCTGQSSNICAPSDPMISYTYQWYHNGALIGGSTAQCITVIPAANDTFSVEVKQPSGCNFNLRYAGATLQPGFASIGNCGDYTFTDTSKSTLGGTITGWNWSFPGGNPSTGSSQTATVSYNTPGTYTVTLTMTGSSGCTATVTHIVNPTAKPTPAFTSTPVCKGGPVTFTNTSVSQAGDPITSWNWIMTGGNPASSTSQNTSTVYSATGPHTVMLIATSQGGCKDTVLNQVTVYAPPTPNFSGSGSGCAPLCVTNYTDASVSSDVTINNWVWSFPGGSPAVSLTQNPGSICYNTPGTYGASLIVTTAFGCKDSITLTPLVNVYPWPKADFCVDHTQVSDLLPVFTFCPLWSPTPGVTKWVWDFGDASPLDTVSTNPVHSYAPTTTTNDFSFYTVKLLVKNQYGCWDTISKVVELIPEFTFYIPNTFTPNGDDQNDFFFGKGRGVKNYNIWVFNRWGNMVWNCHYTGRNTDWDGIGQDGMPSACQWNGKVIPEGMNLNGTSGVVVQQDVYVWKVELTDIFNRDHTYIGHVTIVK